VCVYVLYVCVSLCLSLSMSVRLCVTVEVLQSRLEMARSLKQLTDLAHTMSDAELDDLRLHTKVPSSLQSAFLLRPSHCT